MEAVHTPVLLDECLEYLAPRHDGEVMIDGTVGEGGHSFAFLSRFPSLRLVAIDADAAIQNRAKERLKPFGDRVTFYRCWSHDFFARFPADIGKPDTVLLDLGVSLFHYEESGRGFSLRKDEALDMRLDPSGGVTAAELIAALSEKELADVLYQNAEERYSRSIARHIAEARKKSPITTTAALAAIVEASVPAAYRRGNAHCATKTFQALRIEVNGELAKLRSLLENVFNVLNCGGRMGVISFHSLEDRIVKQFCREKSRSLNRNDYMPIVEKGERVSHERYTGRLLLPKGIGTSGEEKKRNPPSRSARLRVMEKVEVVS